MRNIFTEEERRRIREKDARDMKEVEEHQKAQGRPWWLWLIISMSIAAVIRTILILTG